MSFFLLRLCSDYAESDLQRIYGDPLPRTRKENESSEKSTGRFIKGDPSRYQPSPFVGLRPAGNRGRNPFPPPVSFPALASERKNHEAADVEAELYAARDRKFALRGREAKRAHQQARTRWARITIRQLRRSPFGGALTSAPPLPPPSRRRSTRTRLPQCPSAIRYQ